MSHFDRKEFRFEMHIKRSMARLALEHRQGTLLMSSHVTTVSGAPPTVVGESSRISRRWMHSTAIDHAPFFYLVALPFGASGGLEGASLNYQELEPFPQEAAAKTKFVTENHLFTSPQAIINVLVVPTNENVGLVSHRVQISPTEKRDVWMRVYWVTPEAGTVLSENKTYVPPDVIVFFPLDYSLTCSTTGQSTPAVPTYAVRRVGVVLGEDVTFSRFNERVANRRKAPALMHVLFDMSRAEAEIFFRDIKRQVDKRKDADERVVARAIRGLGRARISASSQRDTADETIAKKLSSALAKRRRSHSSGFISTKHGVDDDDKDEFGDMVTDLQEDSE